VSAGRVLAVAAALAATLLAVPLVPAQAQHVVDAAVPDTVTVDLDADAGDAVVFQLDQANFPDQGAFDSAYVRLVHTGEPEAVLALARAGSVWSTSLGVDTPQLVAGTWNVTFVGVGASGAHTLAKRTLDVTSSDLAAPVVRLCATAATASLCSAAPSPYPVGPGGSVFLLVADPATDTSGHAIPRSGLHTVTFAYSGLPQPLPLAYPYALRGDVLPEGVTSVTFQASDRAGHATAVVADIDHDSVAPLLNLTGPAHAYTGVPFQLNATVAETGPYVLRLSSNGTAQPDVKVDGHVASGVNRTTAFTVVSPRNDTVSFEVEAIDHVGTRAAQVLQVRLEKPPTDVAVTNLSIGAKGPLLAQLPVRINATVAQLSGVTQLQVPVSFQATPSQTTTFFVPVPAPSGSSPGTRVVTWETHLPAGRYTVLANASAPATANETAPGNENASLAIEVFLGKLVEGGTTYDIRADDNGLPSAAVEDGGNRSYPLSLTDSSTSKGVAYKFTTSGNVTHLWDPLDPLGIKAAQASASGTGTHSATSSSTKAKASPDVGPLVAALVVALAAVAQRRR